MLKYVNTDVVFQEIPDEVTLAINISNCPCHCPSCHSSYLAEDIGEELNEAAIEAFLQEFGGSISCVCFMGGDADPLEVSRLAGYLRTHHREKKVGWYTGRTVISPLIARQHFDYIKVGPYIAHLGPLKSKSTNQRLYHLNPINQQLEDITARFWEK